MAALFSWLHFSDIHFGHGSADQAWDQRLVVDALRRDVSRAIGRGYPEPDAILLTGDVAFSGASVIRPGQTASLEYVDAERWLNGLLSDLGLGPERCFCIPGNHDVQRTVERADRQVKRLLDALRGGNDHIDTVWAYLDEEAMLRRRLANYLAFAGQYGIGGTGVFWTHTLEIDGARIRLVGLNSSLLCAGDDDFGKLQIGNEQLAKCLIPTSPDELVIVLSHHPFEWLRDSDAVKQTVRRHAHVVLTGHMHDAEAELVQFAGGGRTLYVAAGAVHDAAAPGSAPVRFGYNFGSLFVDGPTAGVRVWPRTWSPKQHDFRIDHGGVPDGAQYQEFVLKRSDSVPGSSAAINPRLLDSSDPAAAVFRAARSLPDARDQSQLLRSVAPTLTGSATGLLVAALDAAQRIPDPQERVRELNAIAVVFAQLGDADRARTAVSAANMIAQSTSDPVIRSDISNTIAKSVETLDLMASAAEGLTAKPVDRASGSDRRSTAVEDVGIRRVRIFLSSPSDVQAERDAAAKVVSELNQTVAPPLGIVLELVGWRTHVYPALGRAQQVINDQVGDYEIFVGIMASRFGTPTGVAGSGTEEEFQIALRRFEQRRAGHILFYFSDAPIPVPRHPDALANLTKVNDFRAKLEKVALVWHYEGANDFANSLRPHLARLLQSEYGNREAAGHRISPPQGATAQLRAAARARLTSLVTEYDVIRDIMQRGPERTRRMQNVLSRMRAIAPDIAPLLSELQQSGSAGDRLGVIAVLQVLPGCEHLPWLLHRFQRDAKNELIEKPFMVDEAAVAVREAVDPLHSRCPAQLEQTINAGLRLLGSDPKTARGERALRDAWERLKDRNQLRP